MKILADYSDLSEEDAKVLKEYGETDFKAMETYAEILTLPSGKNVQVFCDGRVFLEEKEAK